MSFKVLFRDRGKSALDARIARMVALGKRGLNVGVLGKSSARYAGGISIQELAAVHELGLGTAPARSFIGSWFDEKQAANDSIIRRVASLVAAGKLSPEQAIATIGEAFVGSIRQRIAAGIAPPLKAATVRRKKSSTPLIDTGQLRSAIAWEPA